MRKDSIEKIKFKGKLMAVIIRGTFHKDGIEFFTSKKFPQQLGYMKHKKGDIIQEHRHIAYMREIVSTQETLFIKKGCVKVNFYTNDNKYLTSRKLKKGDVILLAFGGHGFKFLEETEMIEVKQGPYAGDKEKVRFNGGEG